MKGQSDREKDFVSQKKHDNGNVGEREGILETLSNGIGEMVGNNTYTYERTNEGRKKYDVCYNKTH